MPSGSGYWGKMSNQLLMLEDTFKNRFFYDRNLERIVDYKLQPDAELVDLTIGQGDKVLEGLDLMYSKDTNLEKIIEFDHMGRKFFLKRIEGTQHGLLDPYYRDRVRSRIVSFQYQFQLTGPGVNKIIAINSIFTNEEEIDTTQFVKNVFYLANGVLGFITDELEVHIRYGERFETENWFDTGYRATENTRSRYFTSYLPKDHIRSFSLGEAEKQNYVLVLFPSRHGHDYEIYNLGTNKHVGGIARTKDVTWNSIITFDVRAFTLNNGLYIAGIEKDKVQLYKSHNPGTKDERFEKDVPWEYKDIKDIRLVLQ